MTSATRSLPLLRLEAAEDRVQQTRLADEQAPDGWWADGGLLRDPLDGDGLVAVGDEHAAAALHDVDGRRRKAVDPLVEGALWVGSDAGTPAAPRCAGRVRQRGKKKIFEVASAAEFMFLTDVL